MNKRNALLFAASFLQTIAKATSKTTLASLYLGWIGMQVSMTALDADELRFAKIFTDHGILQREMTVPIWGWNTL